MGFGREFIREFRSTEEESRSKEKEFRSTGVTGVQTIVLFLKYALCRPKYRLNSCNSCTPELLSCTPKGYFVGNFPFTSPP